MKIVPPPGISVPIELLEQGKEAVETHLSWVLLTDQFVYKWKKPIILPFVDFSTLENRLAAAASELELNRRLAAEIYLGLGAIDTSSGRASWGRLSVRSAADWPLAAGNNSEPVLVMKRIPQEAFLSSQLAAGKVNKAILLELARVLADFHKSNRTTGDNSSPLVEIAKLNALDNFSALQWPETMSLLGDEARIPLGRALHWTEEEFNRIRHLLLERTGILEGAQGCLVDGHGDLRLEHVAILPANKPRLKIIDCVEFSDDLRRIDQAADLAFLAMDLEFNRRADLAEILESSYSSFAGDESLGEVMPWFKAYRAMVRAKVHTLRAGQYSQAGDFASAREQINFAKRYIALACRGSFGIKRFPLIVVCGLSGSGKSTVAEELGCFFDALVLNSDLIRKEKFKGQTTESAYGEGLYSNENRRAIYDQIFDRAGTYLQQGNPVILDATFQNRSLRKRAYSIAQSAMVPCVLIECLLNRDEAIDRLRRRQQKGESISDAGPEVYEEQLKAWEPIQRSEQFRHFILRTDGGARGAISNSITLLEPHLAG